MKKCCSACFTRIMRKISQVAGGSVNSNAGNNSSNNDKNSSNANNGGTDNASNSATDNTKAGGNNSATGSNGNSVSAIKKEETNDNSSKDSKATSGPSASAGGSTGKWTDEETEKMKSGLRAHGRSWPQVSERVPTRTAEQCKKFFYDNRKRLGLDKIVSEYKKVRK